MALYGPVTLARLARQPCRAGVAGATGRGPLYATPALVNHPHQRGSSCHASACGATVWHCRTSPACVTKKVGFTKTFFLRLVLKY